MKFSFERLKPGLPFVVVVFVLSCSFLFSSVVFASNGVKLRAKVPTLVEVNLNKPEVPVTLTLSNSAITDVELRALNLCSVRLWKVLDGRAVSVGEAPACSLDPAPEFRVLAGGESVVEEVVVPIRPQMLRENETYVLQYRFWGLPVEAKFKIRLVK